MLGRQTLNRIRGRRSMGGAAGLRDAGLLCLLLACVPGAAVFAAGAPAAPVPALTVIDVNKVPWDRPSRGKDTRLLTKTVFTTPEKGRVIYYFFPPTWDAELHPAGSALNPARTHYHEHHEWGYILSGDYLLHEAVSPYQRNPAVYRYKEGTWLSRPAYSLHSGDWATGGFRSQNPAAMILLEEGDMNVTLLPDNKIERRSSHTKKASTESVSAQNWNKLDFPHPWLVETAANMEWEIDRAVEGRFVKWLSDNPTQGFRAQLVKIPPGWQPPKDARRTKFNRAHRVRYVLYGDLRVWSFDDAAGEGKPITTKPNTFIYQPAGSIWGYGDGAVTEEGAVWLEVTYARGLTIGGGPIEEPAVIR